MSLEADAHMTLAQSFVFADHLPVLAVLVPMLAAPLTSLMRDKRLAAGFTIVATLTTFYVVLRLLGEVLAEGTLSYHLGGWAPPIGIEFRVDTANAFVALIVASIGAIVAVYAPRSVDKEIGAGQQNLFYTAYLLCLAGLLGVTLTGDAFNLFVFLEISSLSTYALIAMGAKNDRRALTASYTYLVMGTVGATFYVIGLGLAYMMTGTLNMADLAERLPAMAEHRTVVVGFAFIVIGLALKLAMFPLHLWLPNAYAYAPSIVTGFLAATATKVAIYALVRFIFTIYGPEVELEGHLFSYLIMPLALLGMVMGSIVAIFQANAKRLLAYSSVAQVGYMLLGISFLSAGGLTASLLHLFNHALMKGALFLALGAVMWKMGGVTLDKLKGAGKTMPWTMAAFVGGGLSLIGVPTTVGFVSKWLLIEAALQKGWWPVVIVIVISSLLAVIYVWRIIEAAYLREPPAGVEKSEAPLSMLIPIWVLVLANFWFGLNAATTTGIAERAARELMHLPPLNQSHSGPRAELTDTDLAVSNLIQNAEIAK